MLSLNGSDISISSNTSNCTTASSFQKEKSLKFEILFGDYKKKISQKHSEQAYESDFKYFFYPGQIFGFSCQSMGLDFKKFHYAFILRACGQGDIGHIIPGISPGAEILLKTLTAASSLELKSVLTKLKQNRVNLTEISPLQYQRLNHLLYVKSNLNFFIGELVRGA